MAVASNESGFNQDARSGSGAIGVMQLMAPTARDMGVDPYSLSGNIEGGIKYLAYLLQRYSGDVTKALWAYNGGMANTDKGVMYRETRAYVPRVLASYEEFGGNPTKPHQTDRLPLVGALDKAMAVGTKQAA
jgi:soluble lytic murein transglycosylase-like protein